MLSRLRRYLRPQRAFDAPLRPETVVSVVGDIHGMLHQCETLLDQVPGQVVLVGDLVDRGDHSAEVIDLVMDRPGIVSLMGNHEAMLLAFLDNPTGRGARWLRYGGLQTLASYGVGGDLSAAGLPRLRDALATAMGDARIDWLRARPLFWQSGNLVVTHARPDPGRPIAEQGGRLLWGHDGDAAAVRQDGQWVAHGHVIVAAPQVGQGVIMVDTGAYAGGPLTAAIIDPDGIGFASAP